MSIGYIYTIENIEKIIEQKELIILIGLISIGNIIKEKDKSQ